MAVVDHSLDVYQGFNYKKDKQTPVGFLTKMKVGDKEMKVDITIKDPTAPETDLKCVAVLESCQWATGPTDPVHVFGRISTQNKQDVGLLVLKELTKIDVLFQFTVYDYDPIAKKYFKAFHAADTDMKGILEKEGGDLSLGISGEPAGEVQSPENYGFWAGIKPQPEAQVLHVATSDTNKVALPWGRTVGA